MAIRLRQATSEDCKFFFDLRRSNDIQKYSRNRFTASYTDHMRWFKERVNSCYPKLFVAYDGSISYGYVRFEQIGESRFHEISFAIAPFFQGKGYAVSMMRAAICLFTSSFTNSSITILATVSVDNLRSQRVLERLGFRNHKADIGIPCYDDKEMRECFDVLVLDRDSSCYSSQ